MKYFTLQELTRSATASELNIANVPNPIAKAHLEHLVDTILDPLRERVGQPITVNSGYRCKKLNAAVGGEPNSQHLYGLAADICLKPEPCVENYHLGLLLFDMHNFDQLIFEGCVPHTLLPRWIHVSCVEDTQIRRGNLLKRNQGENHYIAVSALGLADDLRILKNAERMARKE